MIIELIGDGLEIDDQIKQTVDKKFSQKIDRILKTFAQDLRKGSMRISKGPRWGYRVNFNMWLPGNKQIFSEESNENIQTAIIHIRNTVEREIKEYTERVNNR